MIMIWNYLLIIFFVFNYMMIIYFFVGGITNAVPLLAVLLIIYSPVENE